MPCCVATNQKPPNHKQHIQSSKVPDQIKCFVSIHFNDISFMVESCKDIPCLLICNFIELPVITSTLESLEQMIHILKYQLACSMTLCLWVIQFGELANLHAPPSTKNQPFKNYRHLPIKMVAPLSKAFSWWPSQRLGFRRPEALRQHAARLALAGILRWNMLETEGRKPVKTATSPIWIIPEERLRKHIVEMEVASDFQVEHPSEI